MEEQKNITLIARVILVGSGNIFIAVKNGQVVLCTNHSLLALFSSPLVFVNESYKEFKLMTGDINTPMRELKDIPGLTLATVYSDKHIECRFPELFKILIKAGGDNSPEKSLDMKDYMYQSSFSDTKEHYIHMYLNLVNQPSDETIVNRYVALPSEVEHDIIHEMLNSRFKTSAPKTLNRIDEFDVDLSPSVDVIHHDPESSLQNLVKSPEDELKGFVSVAEYATIHSLKPEAVYHYIKNGRMLSAKKINSKWHLSKNDKPTPTNKKRGNPGGKPVIRLPGSSYEEVQQHIETRGIVTSKVRPFIRDYKEALYYERNNYHEVHWDGIIALIIDINPHYYCERLGKTNADLILAGDSPVVPNNDEYVYHLHHIGQKRNSPLAIIPEYDHNSKELYSHFHPTTPTENLHDKQFEIIKKEFWRKYLKEYEIHTFFSKIPFKNHKRPKNNK